MTAGTAFICDDVVVKSLQDLLINTNDRKRKCMIMSLPKRVFGATGMELSAISFGGLPMQRCSMKEAELVLNTALDAGINFIDTARAYTDSEEKIGKVAHRRAEFYLASKSMARSAEAMYKDILTSLELMKTDCIDLYQIHNVKKMEELELVLAADGALQGLKKAQAEGKIKHIGITGHSLEVLIKAVKTNEFASVQVPYNFIEQKAADELFPLARERRMGIIIMKPLGGGQLNEIKLSLRFILQQPDVIIIPGMDDVTHVQENLSVLKPYIALNAQELATLKAEADIVGENFCRRCAYCMPCPKGIDIPQIFIFQLQYKRYNLVDAIPKRYAAMPVKASACVNCGACEKKCPYNIPIRQRLTEMRELMGDM